MSNRIIQSQEFPKYFLIEDGYFEEHDLVNVGPRPLDQLVKLCDSDDRCVAFTSDGKLKHKLVPYQNIDRRPKPDFAGTYVKFRESAEVHCKYPFQIHLHQEEDIISFGILTSFCWEPRLTELMTELGEFFLQEKKSFLDVGANIGYYSLLAAKIGVNVQAIEPLKINYQLFERSIKENEFSKQIKLHRYAVGDQEQTVNMVTIPGNYGASRIAEHHYTADSAKMKRIDNFINPNDIGYMKIDVEGYEWDAIEGCGSFFNDRFIEALILEIDLGEKKAGRILQGVKFLTEVCGYQMHFLGTQEYGVANKKTSHMEHIAKGGGRIVEPLSNQMFLEQLMKTKPDNFGFFKPEFLERYKERS